MKEQIFRPNMNKSNFMDCYFYLHNIQIQLESLQEAISSCRNALVYSALDEDLLYNHMSQIQDYLLMFQTLEKDLVANYNRLNKTFDSNLRLYISKKGVK